MSKGYFIFDPGGGRNEVKNNDRREGWSQKMMIGGWRRSIEASPYICIAKKNDARGEEGVQKMMIGGGGVSLCFIPTPPWIKNGIALTSTTVSHSHVAHIICRT